MPGGSARRYWSLLSWRFSQRSFMFCINDDELPEPDDFCPPVPLARGSAGGFGMEPCERGGVTAIKTPANITANPRTPTSG